VEDVQIEVTVTRKVVVSGKWIFFETVLTDSTNNRRADSQEKSHGPEQHPGN
jgi:hypothetical protein